MATLPDELGRTPVNRQRVAASLFAGVHVLVLSAWNQPLDLLAWRRLQAAVAPYVEAVGLWQRWTMFAPGSVSADLRVVAAIRYQDGGRRIVDLPTMSTTPFPAFVAGKCYRRWCEALANERRPEVLADAVAWVRRHEGEPGRTIAHVSLVATWRALPPPGGGGGDETRRVLVD